MKKKTQAAAVKFVRVTEGVHSQLLSLAAKLQERNGTKTDLGDAVAYAVGSTLEGMK